MWRGGHKAEHLPPPPRRTIGTQLLSGRGWGGGPPLVFHGTPSSGGGHPEVGAREGGVSSPPPGSQRVAPLLLPPLTWAPRRSLTPKAPPGWGVSRPPKGSPQPQLPNRPGTWPCPTRDTPPPRVTTPTSPNTPLRGIGKWGGPHSSPARLGIPPRVPPPRTPAPAPPAPPCPAASSAFLGIFLSLPTLFFFF